uniref:T9SS type A sorting domain-containing protein n=1 Tax=candidate division WOR-3 bacterium TaxID=2052148 RepID=A0A7V1EH33_UNCW3
MKVRMQPDVDVDGFNFVWAVWDSGSWVSGTAEILYSKRDNLGGCLIPETDVSNNASFSHLPRVAVDASNNVQFIWRDASPQGDGVWHAKLANDGSVLVPSHLAMSGAGGGSSSLLPEMVINKYKEICIIWDEEPSGYNQMDFTKLDSIGNPIIAKIRVSPESVLSFWPGIGVDSFGNNHLGYRTNKTSTDSLAYTKLNKDGNFLIDYKALDAGLLPTIIADRSQNIHMVYPHQTGYGWVINYLKLNQNGNIIIGPKTLYDLEYYGNPHMAMDSMQYLHVVWEEQTASGTFPIYYAKIDTLGNFVIPPMQVVYPPYTPGGGLPRIAVDRNNRLHLIWVDVRIDPNTTDIFYKRGENEQTVKELERLKAQNQPKISIFPNPFTTETKVIFSLSHPGSQMDVREETERGKIEIFDILGRKVKEFDYLPKAQYGGNCSFNQIVWNGKDEAGCKLPAGVYLLWLEFGGFRKMCNAILIR